MQIAWIVQAHFLGKKSKKYFKLLDAKKITLHVKH